LAGQTTCFYKAGSILLIILIILHRNKLSFEDKICEPLWQKQWLVEEMRSTMGNFCLICIPSGGNLHEKYDPFTHCFVFLAAASASICHLQKSGSHLKCLNKCAKTYGKIFY
jgi:hypothetical protein